MRPAAAISLLAALAAAALLATHVWAAATITGVLLLVCLRAPRGQRRIYIAGTAVSAAALFLLTPFIETLGSPYGLLGRAALELMKLSQGEG